MRIHFIFLLFCCFFINAIGYTQSFPESGSPIIKNYTTNEINGGPQIFCIVQDKRGMVYVGDGSGIIEFNGREWRRIQNNNNSIVRDMAADSLGVIYVGASGDFGYLQPGPRGEMEYISLAQTIIDQKIKFQDIWKVISTPRGVYFFSNKYIFKYYKKKVSVIPVSFLVQDAYLLNKQLYLPTKDGLCLLNDSVLVKLTPKSFFLMTPMGENKAIAIAGTNGRLVVFNLLTLEFSELKTKLATYIETHPLASISNIDDEKFVLATGRGSIAVISKSGELIRFIDKTAGLLSAKIYSLYVDKDKNLWVCTSKGISKIDINYPVLKFDELQDVAGNVQASCMFNGRRYIATIDGIYYLSPFDINKPDESQRFIKIKTFIDEFWDFMEIDHQLYAISSQGLWIINDTNAKQIYNIEVPQKAHCFNTSPLFPDRVFIGMRGKLVAVKLKSGSTNKQVTVIDEIEFPEIIEKIRRITSDKDGNLWMNTQFNGIYFMRFIGGDIQNYRVTLLGKQNGLPNLDGTRTYKVNNEITIATESGIFQPVFPSGNNLPDSLIRFEYTRLFGDTIKDPFVVVTPISGNNYLIAGNGIHYATINGTKQTYDTCGFSRLNCTIEKISFDNDSILSISAPEGLFNYDIKNHRNFKEPFNTIISKVKINNDSTIFSGSYYRWVDSTKVVSLIQTPEFVPTIDYKLNSVGIYFSGLFFEDPEGTEFQYQLVGFNKEWSKWSTDNRAIYTNLIEGKYTFKVIAKNVYGIKSNVAEYSFIILPPWYRSLWAYLFYFLLFSSIIFVSIRIYTRLLLKQNYYLELLVESRMDEIIGQARELEKINEKLIEMGQFKQGITSMIVHDLKNPINSIIHVSESKPEAQLERIRQTGKQMLNLVLNILDIYKYEETKIIINSENHNLFNLAQEAIENILFLSNEKNISISNLINPEVGIKADAEMIERVFVNILTNAIKYTPNNGKIIIEAEPVNQFIKIAITDNGIGIQTDKIDLVFQKFGQVIAKNSGSVRSTGLGLTYCKMVIEAHGGLINVESELGKGSTFWFTLPRDDDHTETNRKAVSEETQIVHPVELSEKSQQIIWEYLLELKQTEIYKLTELTVILDKIDDSTNDEIRMWKQALIRAIDSGNQMMYEKLLNPKTNNY
jgi:signal transduction histidine kinase